MWHMTVFPLTYIKLNILVTTILFTPWLVVSKIDRLNRQLILKKKKSPLDILPGQGNLKAQDNLLSLDS